MPSRSFRSTCDLYHRCESFNLMVLACWRTLQIRIYLINIYWLSFFLPYLFPTYKRKTSYNHHQCSLRKRIVRIRLCNAENKMTCAEILMYICSSSESYGRIRARCCLRKCIIKCLSHSIKYTFPICSFLSHSDEEYFTCKFPSSLTAE